MLFISCIQLLIGKRLLVTRCGFDLCCEEGGKEEEEEEEEVNLIVVEQGQLA